MINEKWKQYLTESDYEDEAQDEYEYFFVNEYLEIQNIPLSFGFYQACKWGLEYCSEKYKINIPKYTYFVFALLFLTEKGLIKQNNESIYNSVLTEEGQEVLTWMKNKGENNEKDKSGKLAE